MQGMEVTLAGLVSVISAPVAILWYLERHFGINTISIAQVALNIPDELTLDHIWKDKKREYSFDAVFAPGATQEKARPATW